jgi:cytochrome c oxidase subunit 4
MNQEGTVAQSHAQSHKEPNYMGVFWWLFALTVIEVGIGYSTFFPRKLYIALLIALAVFKAGLVAAYFMHLKFEKRTLTLIAIFPVVLLVILTIALYPDALSFMRS